MFNTREDSSIGDLSFAAGDWVKFNLETGEAEIYFPEDNFTAVDDRDINPDALSIRADGTFIFSTRGSLMLDGVTINQLQLIDFDPSTRDFSVLFREFDFDISGVDIIDEDNVLLAAKQDTTIGGLSYSIGDIIQYTFSTGTATKVFSADNFLTAAEGGNFTAPANIDAVEMLANGNILFSTSNTAEIGTTPQDVVRVNQQSVYEYNVATGETTLFFDGAVFSTPSTDLKSFSLVPPEVVSSQKVVFNTKDDSFIGELSFRAGDLVEYDLQTGEAKLFFSEDNFGPVINNDINLDALSIRADGTFIFSARGNLELDGVRIDQRSLVDFDPATRDFSVLFRQLGVDIAGLDIIDDDNVLMSAKQDAVIGGLSYSIGDVIQYNLSTDTATIFFSADNFLTFEEGGRFTAPANIDAIELLENGNLLFSTTNSAQVGTTAETAVTVQSKSMYEYNFATGETSLFFDGSVFGVSSSDLKSFSLLPTREPILRGDTNLDGVVSFLDISRFITTLTVGGFQLEADTNVDGEVNFLDINSFILLLAS